MRTAKITRTTAETSIEVEIDLDGTEHLIMREDDVLAVLE